jgi:hypothetical protein
MKKQNLEIAIDLDAAAELGEAIRVAIFNSKLPMQFVLNTVCNVAGFIAGTDGCQPNDCVRSFNGGYVDGYEQLMDEAA